MSFNNAKNVFSTISTYWNKWFHLIIESHKANFVGRVFIKLNNHNRWPITTMFSNSELDTRIRNIRAEIAGNQQRMDLANIRFNLSIFQWQLYQTIIILTTFSMSHVIYSLIYPFIYLYLHVILALLWYEFSCKKNSFCKQVVKYSSRQIMQTMVNNFENDNF